jgi:hypothetical protein
LVAGGDYGVARASASRGRRRGRRRRGRRRCGRRCGRQHRTGWQQRARGELPLAREVERLTEDPRGLLRRVESHRVLGRDEIEPPLRLALQRLGRRQLLRVAPAALAATIVSIRSTIATPPRCMSA